MKVRFHDWFFNSLRAMGAHTQRGEHGEPCAHDFLVVDLPLAQARLEEDYERWAFPTEPAGTWAIVLPGKTVRVFALKFHLAPDGAIEVFDVELEHWGPND